MFTRFRQSLGGRGILFFSLILLVILTGMTVMNVLYQKYFLKGIAIEHSKEIAKLILTSMRYPMLSGDQDIIQTQFDAYRALPEISVVHLTDKNGIIRRSTDRALIGDKPMVSDLKQALQGKDYHAIEVRLRTKKAVVTQLIPILNEPKCYSCHGSSDKVLGVVRLALDWEKTQKALEANTGWNILLSVAGLILMSLLVALFFLKTVVSPIRDLEKGMKKVSQGDLNLKLKVRSKDEIGNLTLLFNKMSGDLKALIEKELILNVSLKTEISERKKVGEALQENKDRLDLALRSSEMGVWHLDVADNKRYFDEQASRLLGIKQSISGLIEEEFFKLIHPDDHPVIKVELAKTLEQETAYEVDYRAVWPDKSVHYLSSRGKLLYDDSGRPLRVNGIIWDITELKRAEHDLRRTRQNLMDIIDFLPDATFVIDKDKRVVAWNKAIEDMTGVPKKEILGKGNYEYAIPFYGERRPVLIDMVSEDLESFKGEYKSITKEKERLSAETYVPRLFQGRGAFLAGVATPLFDEKGDVVGAIETIRDITERKKAEEALAESEKRFMDVMYASQDAILLIDGSVFADCNDATSRMLGYSSRKEFLMVHPSKLSPSLQPDGSDSFEKAEEMMRIASEKGFNRFEWIHRKASGEDFPVEVSLTPIALRGRNVIYCVWRDITERKKVEEELKWKTAFLEAQVESVFDGLLVVDSKGKRILMNQRLIELFKVPQSIVDDKDDKPLLEHVVGLHKNPEQFLEKVEYLYSHQDEDYRDEMEFKDGRVFDRYSAPVKDKEGRYFGRIWVFRDITERKRSEDDLKSAYDQLKKAQDQLLQASKMAAIGQLAGGVAHEINNPLTGVLNNVQLIKMLAEKGGEFKMEEFKDILSVIEESALRCKNITKALLDFAHASRESFQPTKLNVLIESVLDIISTELKLAKVVVVRDLQADSPVINGDPQLLQQVVLGLIANAKWAIDKKPGSPGGSIILKTYRDLKEKSVVILVTDDGVGIPRENLSKMFEPFFTTKDVGEGTGLGLALIYNIIKNHGGSITLESQVDLGTIVKISLPVPQPLTGR